MPSIGETVSDGFAQALRSIRLANKIMRFIKCPSYHIPRHIVAGVVEVVPVHQYSRLSSQTTLPCSLTSMRIDLHPDPLSLGHGF